MILTTHGPQGVNLFTDRFSHHFDSKPVVPVSTIGAGDNFNAGIIYGLLKYDIRHQDLKTLDKETWSKIIGCGIDLSTEVCQSYNNYISREFAHSYTQQS
jgi:fructokinase